MPGRAVVCLLAATLVFLFDPFAARAACDGGCAYEAGRYEASVPDDWNGKDPLPVLVFFHGFGQRGETVTRNARITRPADEAGVLLIAPTGLQRSWSVRGAPSEGRRDEVAAFRALIDDVARRWPIDRGRVFLSGFSLGGSVAWDIACLAGSEVAAIFPAAGVFWRPHPARCEDGPVHISHVHGKADTVMPLDGRVIRGSFRQGNVETGIEIWRRENACAVDPAEIAQERALTCRLWSGCGGGKRLELCYHDGGHYVPKGWLDRSLAWALDLTVN